LPPVVSTFVPAASRDELTVSHPPVAGDNEERF
jgi:hypothetical protein